MEIISILGDQHDDKAVELVEYRGKQFIRKPRSASVEMAFKAFLSGLEEEGFLFVPGVVNILTSSDYEHDVDIVEQISADTAEEIHSFYKRCGSLIFITYLFGSKDIHFENLIAHGEYPTIVDYETLLSGDTGRSDTLSKLSLKDTVLKSHLLPNWSKVGDVAVDIGGLSGKGKNRLLWKEETTYIYDYLEDIIEGFQYAYMFSLNNKVKMQELIHLFDHCRFREILRPTQLYFSISEMLSELEEEKQEEKARELLSRAYKKDIDPLRIVKAKKTLDEEVRAVLHNEIPLFWVTGNQKDLFCREQIVQTEFLQKTPVENSVYRLNHLSAKDCHNQIKIIKQAVESVRPIEKQNTSKENGNICDLIMSKLEKTHIDKLASGWFFLDGYNGGDIRFQNNGFGLYNGLLGILCCYAAAYLKTKRKDILDKLLRHYSSYHRFAIPEKIVIDDLMSGFNEGVGGHINALYHIYELTGVSLFKNDAERLVEAIELLTISTEINVEILNGFAGLALSLKHSSSEKSIQLAKEIAPLLNDYKPMLTGVGHGASGVALSLAALGKKLSTNKFDEKIIELLNWENDNFDLNQQNWYDLRRGNVRSAYMLGWCSGAPGIGMSRKMIMEYTENAEILSICSKDIDRAYKIMLRYGPLKRDHLCCGNSARLVAASKIGFDMDFLLKEVEERFRKSTLGLAHPLNTCDFNAGLMQGISGVGYALLMYGDTRSGDMLL